MKKRLKSFGHAFRGIAEFIRIGINARIQTAVAILIIVVGLFLKFSSIEWIAVVSMIALVLSLEAINTAIELLADEISQEQKESIRNIKDIAAGAVLIAAIASVVVACLLILRHLMVLT